MNVEQAIKMIDVYLLDVKNTDNDWVECLRFCRKLLVESGGVKMSKTQQYEAYKQYLKTLNLSPAEYAERIKSWCKKHNY